MTAELDAADQAWADGLRRRHFPADRNRIAAHVTLFHHLPPSCLPELGDCLAALAREKRPDARIERPYSLGRGVALPLICPDLLAMRDALADRFGPLLTPQDRARPRLHITIQNKVTPDRARDTLREVERDFRPRRVAIAGLAIWAYRGGPWSLVRRYSFRG